MGVVDNSIGDATNKGPHPSVTSAPHHHEPCLDLVRQPDDCCVRPPQHEVRLQSLRPLACMGPACSSNHERGPRLARSESASQPFHISGPRCGTYRFVCTVSLYTLGVCLEAAAYPSLPPVATTRMATATSRVLSCIIRSFT